MGAQFPGSCPAVMMEVPSMVMSLVANRPPPIQGEAPDHTVAPLLRQPERSGKHGDVGVTPGVTSVKNIGLREFSGRSCKPWFPITVLTVEVEDANCTAFATTSNVVVTAPTVNGTSSDTVCCTATLIALATHFWN